MLHTNHESSCKALLLGIAILTTGLALPAAHLPLLAETPSVDAAKFGFENIRAENMRALLSFFASDELEGRNTGDRGLNIAAKFLVSQYQLAGLTPAPGAVSMLQPFDVIESVVQSSTNVRLGSTDGPDTTFRLYRDFFILSHHRRNELVKMDIVFAGYGGQNHDDYGALNADGKFLLVFDGSPELDQMVSPARPGLDRKIRTLRRDKAQWAGDKGAAGILHIAFNLSEQSMDRLRRFLSRPRQKLAQAPPDIPQLVINRRMANALLASSGWQVDSLRAHVLAEDAPGHFTLDNVRPVLTLETFAERKATQNVIAYLEGSDNELRQEVVAFGAHYDHLGKNSRGEIYNGADDDGSGTIAMLEIARAFANNPVRPKRSLVFISHAGEEKGLLGSKYYTDNSVIPLEKTVAQLNIDMIGRNEANSVYIIGSDFLSRDLHKLNEHANEVVALELDYTYNDLNDPNRFYYRSDHYNYAKHGIPVIFYFSGTHADYHKPTDTIEKINFMKMQKISRLIYLTGWQVANSDHGLAKNGRLFD